MDYDKLKIIFKDDIYEISGKGTYGVGVFLRFYRCKEKDKQLGCNGYTEKEIDLIIKTGKLPVYDNIL